MGSYLRSIRLIDPIFQPFDGYLSANRAGFAGHQELLLVIHLYPDTHLE
jgi:hypothetical protein